MYYMYSLFVFNYLSLLSNLIVSDYIKPVVDNTITIIQSENAKGTKIFLE